MATITKDDVDFYIEGFSSGYPWIDYLTGVPDVFFPKGAITEVMGPKSAAKTTLIFESIAQYFKNGGTKKVAYLDFERSVKKQVQYLSALGVPFDSPSFEYYQPVSFQDGGDLILNILRNKNIPGTKKKVNQEDYDFIIVDTVAAMRPAQEIDNALGDTKQQGLRGKLMSELCRNITSDLSSDGPAIIFVNQVFEEISINKGPAAAFLPKTYDSSASNSLKYYAVFRVSLNVRAKIKTKLENPITFEMEDVIVGNVIEATAEKCKIGVPFRKASFVVRYGYGIDPTPTLVKAGQNKNVEPRIILVEGKNSLYSYLRPDGTYSQRINGEVNFLNFVSENKDVALSIAKQIAPVWEKCILNATKTGYFGQDYTEEPESGEPAGAEL